MGNKTTGTSPAMNKTICAFSSNSRELYTGDIYKILSMPTGFIVHFRYKHKYVESKIYESPKNYIGKNLNVFFTDKKNFKNFAVREAKITDIVYTKDTDLVHLYFKLDDFIDAEIDVNMEANNLPPHLFLSELSVSTTKSLWKNKVELLKGYFNDLSFFNIRKISSSRGKEIPLKTGKDQKSYYNLYHGKKYIIDISIGNPSDSKSEIEFTSSSDDVSINMTNPLSVNAEYDNLSIPIYLKSLNVSSESSFLTFSPTYTPHPNTNSGDLKSIKEYRSSIEIIKNVRVWTSIRFGIGSVAAVLSIWSIKDNSQSLNHISSDLDIDLKLIISCIVLIVSSAFMFHKFNKK